MAGERIAYERSVLSEIRMLLDYVASNGAIDMSELSVPDPKRQKKTLGAGKILRWLDDIERKFRNGQNLAKADFAFLQLVRDAVSKLARPATGLTVAFTALVNGSRRSPQSESRATLAEEAYPGLLAAAGWMRFNRWAVLVIAVICIAIAISVAAEVARGKVILGNLDGLRAQQTSINAEKLRLEETLDKEAGPTTKLLFVTDNNQGDALPERLFALCDRPYADDFYAREANPRVSVPLHWPKSDAKLTDPPPEPLKLYASPEQRDVCERDRLLAINFFIVHQELWNLRLLRLVDPSGSPAVAAAASDEHQDVEFSVAPWLLVWGNYVLPIIFGSLGALMFVILELYGKLKESRLDPRDNAVIWLRLVLGLATGTCIGLFVSSSYGTATSASAAVAASGTASNLVGPLTLSASGLAFLAGFGVESVFRMLQGLVSRVFVSEPSQAQRG